MHGDNSLLVPIDFEEASLEALATARELSARFGMEIVLLHVFTLPVVAYPGFAPIPVGELPAMLASAAQGALNKLAAEQGGLRALLRAGDPAMEILAAIEELKPALVAMGVHGREGVAHWFLGRVTERVVRASPVPVLTVRAKPR
jgi:nucleotide-binding universal stress UspA family protein